MVDEQHMEVRNSATNINDFLFLLIIMTHLYALLFIEIINSGYGSPYQASGQASPALPEPQMHPSGRKSVLAKFSSRLNVPGFMHQKMLVS